MALYRIQGNAEKAQGIYYEFDPNAEPLGVGGMGTVYKGRCVNERTRSTRNVAIKFMYSDLPEYAIEKARREAAIQFRHENLVEMLGFIETESKSVLGETQHHYHVVSELLQGVPLDQLLTGKLTDQKGQVVPYAEKLYKDYQNDPEHFAVMVVKNILSGLSLMHDNGYIHRDIDPTNIMVTTEGKIKLIDFGIAKKFNNLNTTDRHLTQAGQFVGKAEYAAPELVLGSINEQNQTTDLYAVGIVLYQLIVGHVPFHGDRSDVLQMQLHSSMPLSKIKNKGLREIIKKATAKSRSKRYQSAAEFRVALDQLNAVQQAGFEWKNVYTYACAGVAACAILAFVLPGLFKNGEPETVAPTYATAVNLLHQPDHSAEGLEMLEELSADGDAEATYLLSRLYFKSKLINDYKPDSLAQLQRSAKIVTDNEKAHRLLVSAVELDNNNYPALFELACDYWKADQRTEAVPERNGTEAEELFVKARQQADANGDTQYVEMIDNYLESVNRWKEKLKSIKN